MDTQRETAHTIRRPRSPEDRETVKRQQKELRRIRQRARRESMTEEQIQQRRERGRDYYVRKKIQHPMKKTKQKDVAVDQARMDKIVQSIEVNILNPCTTAEEIKQLSKRDCPYQSELEENVEDPELMKQTEPSNTEMDQEMTDHFVQSIETVMLSPRNNRLTHVKRQARTLDNQMVTGNKDARPPRIIHIRRQARALLSGVVDRSDENGFYGQKLGNSPCRNGSISRLEEHAQILIDISRMNGHTSTSVIGDSGGSMQIDLNKGAVDNYLDQYEDSRESTSDSEEVLAFLMGLSGKKGQCREH